MDGRRALAFVAVVLFSFPLIASSQRTFVASTGNDANTCSRDQPCRSFAAAITQTNANGEVVAIDSAGYGPVTITQSVTIVAPLGVHAGISVFSGDGVTVTGGDSAIVALKNLFINSQGGVNGITLSSAQELYIDHCTVSGFAGNDINLVPSAFAFVSIVDTTARDALQSGIYADGVPAVHIFMDRCLLAKNTYGLAIDRCSATIRNSAFTHQGSQGILVRGTGGSPSVTMIDSTVDGCNIGIDVQVGNVALSNCMISGNGAGISSAAGTTVRLSRNTITRNIDGVDVLGGTVNSITDNLIDGNLSVNVLGSITAIPAK
jgi:hypothetical protein